MRVCIVPYARVGQEYDDLRSALLQMSCDGFGLQRTPAYAGMDGTLTVFALVAVSVCGCWLFLLSRVVMCKSHTYAEE